VEGKQQLEEDHQWGGRRGTNGMRTRGTNGMGTRVNFSIYLSEKL